MDASLGVAVELPDVEPILPYIGLFTLVTLKPAQVTGCTLITGYLPSVSTLCGSKFVEAPSNTLPTAESAARIFHSIAINNDTPLIEPWRDTAFASGPKFLGNALLAAPSFRSGYLRSAD